LIVPQFIRIRFLLYLMRVDGANGATLRVRGHLRGRGRRTFVKNRLMRDGGEMINAPTASAAVKLAARDLRYVLRKGERLSANRLLVVRHADVVLRYVISLGVEVHVAHEVVG
jgi:hypothetical protein